MSTDLYTITTGNLYVNDEALVRELVHTAAKHSKDVGTLVTVVSAIGNACGVTIALGNTLLTTFALKKAKEIKKPKKLSNKMASYHAFRSQVKEDLKRIIPGGQDAPISEINRFASMVWKAIANELKEQWANEFTELTTERINKWNEIFRTTINSTLEEDTDSMIAAEEHEERNEEPEEHEDTNEQLEDISEENTEDISRDVDKKHKKKRPRTSVPPEYASFYELMLPYYTELDSIASRAEAKQLIEHVWQKLEDGHSNGWIVVHDKPGDKTKWINLFIKYAKCVLENP